MDPGLALRAPRDDDENCCRSSQELFSVLIESEPKLSILF
jgi:hypothetical protein